MPSFNRNFTPLNSLDFFEDVKSKKRKSGKQKRGQREKQFYLRWTGSWFRQLKIF